MTVALPEGVHTVTARGRTYYYWQPGRGTARAAARRRIPGDPSDPRFWQFLADAGADTAEPAGTLASAVEQWQASAEWKALAAATRRDYDRYVEHMLDRWGDWQLDAVTRAELRAWRREFGDRLVTANHAMAVARSLFEWAIEADLAEANPAAGIRNHQVEHRQAEPWPQWALDLAHAHGRWEFRAFVELARYTGQRTADIVAMTLRHFGGGRVAVIQAKTGKPLSIPIHPRLAPTLEEARARGSIALFPSRDGTPISAESFRALFWRELRKPELEPLATAGLSPHGLRALVTNHLLEVDCTVAQVSAITGMSLVTVQGYARARDQARLADQAMEKWTEGEERQ